jgi:hypothetical protein
MAAHPQPSRRDLLRAAGYGASLVGMMSTPLAAQAMNAQPMKPKVFVLVHPAWHGAWFWKKVVPLLRQKGHLVFTPTLTGLGERRHLARAEILQPGQSAFDATPANVAEARRKLAQEFSDDVLMLVHNRGAASCDRLNQRTFPIEAMIAFTFSGAKNSAGEIVPA